MRLSSTVSGCFRSDAALQAFASIPRFLYLIKVTLARRGIEGGSCMTAYSSIVFFSPTLKPSVSSGLRSSYEPQSAAFPMAYLQSEVSPRADLDLCGMRRRNRKTPSTIPLNNIP